MDEHEPFRRVGPPDPTASLEQTLDWLKQTILGTEVNYTLQPADASSQISETYEEMNYEECNVTVRIIDANFDAHRISFRLQDLSEIGQPIKMPYSGTAQWKVPLEAVGSKNVIQERFGATSYTSFAVSTPEMAQRVANAFNHAIRLCRKQALSGG